MFLLKDIDREAIKMSNSKKILQLLYKEGQLTKQDIAKTLGISIPTVTHNVNTLIEEGFVREAGMAVSTGGRKPIVMEFLPDAKYSVGVDIRPHGISIIITNLKSHIISQKELQLLQDDTDEVMTTIDGALKEMLEKHDIKRSNLLGVGFSLHGTVNENKLIFEMAPNASYKNIDFHKYEDLFGTSVYIENEANASAISESLLGVAKQMRNLIYISINEGVGTGIVIKGYLYKGKNDRAGEFGHMVVNPEGPSCNCGSIGCWETFVSTLGLQRLYKEKANQELKIEDIVKRFREGDHDAIQVLNQYTDYLALGLRNILFALDPHYIVIGGEMSKYGDDYYHELINKIYSGNIFYSQRDNKIIISNLDGKAAVLGASLLPLLQLLYGTEKVI
ncbi:ROK family transcriptional regulator [Vallitalea okinawensis]|uniref:ROK family transcriptional regulator n=1 Tax=Vallitalea okinawensis TaxID=2078660 RepID=UPI000CFB5097|nr:ROK family transcriptional regulator [Vallitalea okinawensis]